LKSYFEIFDNDLLDKWLNDPERNACLMRATYFGMSPSGKKGSE